MDTGFVLNIVKPTPADTWTDSSSANAVEPDIVATTILLEVMELSTIATEPAVLNVACPELNKLEPVPPLAVLTGVLKLILGLLDRFPPPDKPVPAVIVKTL